MRLESLPLPQDLSEEGKKIIKYLNEYVINELVRVLEESEFEYVNYVELFAEPAKLKERMVVFADGTTWDPGSGRGVYIYSSGAWVPVTPALGDTSWTAPTLLNSWVNYGAAYNTAGYMKDAQGFVHLRGLVKTGVAGTVIFILPAGYRPVKQELHIVNTYIGATNDSWDETADYPRIDITTSGDVECVVGFAGWVSLDGITFKAV
mgnify:CR=1 FL=1